MAHLRVDAKSGSVSYEPNDGTNKWWKPDAYAEFLKDQNKALDAVAALGEVKRYCAWLERHKSRCILRLDEPPEAPCPASPGLHDPCLWSVAARRARAAT